MFNILTPGIETPKGVSKLKQIAFFLNNVGIAGKIVLLTYLTAPILLASVPINYYVDNYRGYIAEITNNGGAEKPNYRCGDGALSQFKCNPVHYISGGKQTKIIRLEDNTKFGYAQEYKLSKENLPSDEEINKLITALREFIKNNPENIKINIEGQSSPEGYTKDSLTGLDVDSLDKNEKLAKERAEYIKAQIQSKASEFSEYVHSIHGIVKTLSYDDLDRLEEISSRIIPDGNIQDFIKKYNSGELTFSEDDKNFLSKIFYRGTNISVSGENIKMTEGFIIDLGRNYEIFLPYILAGLTAAYTLYVAILHRGLDMSVKKLIELDKTGNTKAKRYKTMLGALKEEEFSKLLGFLEGCNIGDEIGPIRMYVFKKDNDGTWIKRDDETLIDMQQNAINNIRKSEITTESSKRIIAELEKFLGEMKKYRIRLTDNEMAKYIEYIMLSGEIERKKILNPEALKFNF